MFIIKYKTLFIGLSVFLLVASVFSVLHFGIKKGIDFTGGTVVEIRFQEGKEINVDHKLLQGKGVKVYSAPGGYKFISQKSHEEVQQAIASAIDAKSHPYVETQVNNVGPSMGSEMTKKATIAIVIVAIAILSFIAFAFREVSVPVASWKYGVVAMVTIIHDIIVPTGVYAFLSSRYGAEVDTLFAVALLTVMAITISDKIVVFDRIRENLKVGGAKRHFDLVVGESLKQTFVRSVNTSMTTVLSLIALYFYGPESTKFFSLTLIAGIIVGTYSSIFVASPLLTYFVKKQ